VVPGAYSAFGMVWTNNFTGEETAHAYFTCHMTDPHEGTLRIQMDDMEQTVFLTPRPRKLGGYQWYFVCPVINRCCSVLWMPPGAARFCSRQVWGSQVAYASQFLDPINRAHRGKAKIKAILIGNQDPDEWDLPPKPKGMRWSTYNRYVERFEKYQAILDYGVDEALAKLSSE
jgi:hypothetical protein